MPATKHPCVGSRSPSVAQERIHPREVTSRAEGVSGARRDEKNGAPRSTRCDPGTKRGSSRPASGSGGPAALAPGSIDARSRARLVAGSTRASRRACSRRAVGLSRGHDLRLAGQPDPDHPLPPPPHDARARWRDDEDEDESGNGRMGNVHGDHARMSMRLRTRLRHRRPVSPSVRRVRARSRSCPSLSPRAVRRRAVPDAETRLDARRPRRAARM